MGILANVIYHYVDLISLYNNNNYHNCFYNGKYDEELFFACKDIRDYFENFRNIMDSNQIPNDDIRYHWNLTKNYYYYNQKKNSHVLYRTPIDQLCNYLIQTYHL